MRGIKSESNRVVATRKGFDGRLLRCLPAVEAPEATATVPFEYN